MAKEVKPLHLKTSTHTGVMRGRDVRSKLALVDLHPEVKAILETQAEINHTNTLAIAELAQMVDGIINIVQNFADISENMKNKMKQIERGTNAEVEGDEGAGSSTQH